MEIDLKELLVISAILLTISGLSYFLFILDNQNQIIKVQGYTIKNQNVEIKEKEDMLEQERILNEDKDGDGLVLREELNLGTFDTDIDSDGDSVPDNFDVHPTGGGRMIVKFLEWDYLGRHWTFELIIPSDIIAYYERVPRPRWQENYSYFSEFINLNDKGTERLANGLKSFIDQYKEVWSYYDEVMFVVSMVRQLHYTSDILVGFDQFTKFPMQTLNDGTGDCEDMAILAAAILKEIGYNVKLVFLDVLNGENHVAIAVLGGENYTGTYFERNGNKYFYIEIITDKYGFGELPSRWDGSIANLIDIE